MILYKKTMTEEITMSYSHVSMKLIYIHFEIKFNTHHMIGIKTSRTPNELSFYGLTKEKISHLNHVS